MKRPKHTLAIVLAVLALLQIVELAVDPHPSRRWPAWLWWTTQVSQPLFLAWCGWTLLRTPPLSGRPASPGMDSASGELGVEGRA